MTRLASRPVCGRVGYGYVVVGSASANLVVRNPRCKQAANMAAIQLRPSAQIQSGRRSGRINGIPVLSVRPPGHGFVSYLAPTLHVLVTARGPLASRVLGTLTRSRLSVVLEAGSRPSVPHNWRWHDFGGIRFATPTQWRTINSRVWYPCWAAITSTEAVELVNATLAVAFSCSSAGGGMRASHGVVVGAGRYVSLHGPAGYGCRSLHGLRACFAMPGPGGPLELAVYVPGRHKPTVVDVGLEGNGAEARMIVESIRPR